MPTQQHKPATLNAVLEYARQLNLRADVATARDPYADPYRPTEAAAKRVFYHHFAEVRRRDAADPEIETPDEIAQRAEASHLALGTLAGRAWEKQCAKQEADQVSKRSLERLQRRQRDTDRDRDQRRRGLTIGQRLDEALAAFSVVSSVNAAQVGWSTPGVDRPVPTSSGDAGGEARDVALRAVREVESLLDAHQRRDVGRAA